MSLRFPALSSDAECFGIPVRKNRDSGALGFIHEGELRRSLQPAFPSHAGICGTEEKNRKETGKYLGSDSQRRISGALERAEGVERLLCGLRENLCGERCPGSGSGTGFERFQAIADCRSGKNRTGHKLFRHSLGNREGCGNRKKLDLHPGGVRNRLSAGAVYLRPFKTGNPLSQAVFPGYRTRVLSHQMADCGEPGLWRNERACFRNICGQ